jgi:hypothetical protein
MSTNEDIKILRRLAEQAAEASRKSIQEEKRKLWKKHNSLKKTRVLIYVNVGMWDFVGSEVITKDVLKCSDPFYRYLETKLRCLLFKDSIGDDDIIEPWISIDPVFKHYGWGPVTNYITSGQVGGAFKIDPPIKELEDINKLVVPKHEIDHEKSSEYFRKAEDAIGDIIEIDRRKANAYLLWAGDLAYLLGQLLGIEQIMYYMYDRPEWLHRILAFLRDGILKVYDEAEESGDWGLTTGYNQAMTYSEELPDPQANSCSVRRDQLWIFNAAQEYALISPQMHEEFLLRYQLPIIEKFGLSAYGCCEDLTNKISMLKRIPNLRRISVTPWADVAKCAEQIEDKYVLSWRPNPSSTICDSWDPEYIRKYVKSAMDACRGCIVDITLKDVQTVKGEIWRAKKWVEIVRDVCEQY